MVPVLMRFMVFLALALMIFMVYLRQGCPTSSTFTNSQNYETHAMRRWAQDGTSFSLSTDDPGVMRIDLNGEYTVANVRMGISKDAIVKSVSEIESQVCGSITHAGVVRVKIFPGVVRVKVFPGVVRVKIFPGVVRVKMFPGVVRVKIFPILYTVCVTCSLGAGWSSSCLLAYR